jgi:hypothetical protein
VTVQALFIDPKGPYPALLGAENCWDERRDARTYAGTDAVIVHPPCAAWCQLAGVREAKYGYPRGEDGGLFAAALVQVRSFGGVLEHPAYTKAWPAHGLTTPTKDAGWLRVEDELGEYWVCHLSQSAYGHRARKRTWLLYVGSRAPYELNWTEPYVPGTVVISGAKNHSTKPTERMWTREAKRTPVEFAQELIRLAEWSRG